MEAIGLVLGVAPLIVELLKANPQPIHAAKAVRNEAYIDMADDFYLNLGYEMSMLRLMLTGLVQELPVDVSIKARLLQSNNLDTAIWRDPPHELQLALAQRLGPCLETFQKCMDKMLHQLSKLVKDNSVPVHLSAEEVRIESGRSYAKLEKLFAQGLPARQKLKFGWRKDKRDGMVSALGKYNRKLQDMLERSSVIAPTYAPPEPKASTGCMPHLGLRQRMSDLRTAIGRAWCKCTGHEHELRFSLSKAEIDDAHITLDMLMNLSREAQKYQWGESKMRIRLQKDDLTANTGRRSPERHYTPPSHRRRSSTLTGTTLFDSPQNSPRRESPVLGSFRTSRLPSVPQVTPITDSQPGASPGRYADAAQIHENICATMAQNQRRRRASSITLHDDELWHHKDTLATQVSHRDPGVALSQYLLDKRWTMRDRKVLQVLLAHSVLFFPWKGSDLNKDAIAFHHDPPHKPFASLAPDRSEEELHIFPAGEQDPEDAFQPYPNETLAALAIVLLEIELRKPIESKVIEEDVADDDPKGFLTRYWTAVRVLQEERYNMFQGCYAAIDACIRCDFGDSPTDLDNKEFLEQVYMRIVAPLEAELLHGFPHMQLPISEPPSSFPKQPTVHVNLSAPITSADTDVEVESLTSTSMPLPVLSIPNRAPKHVRMAVAIQIPDAASTAGATA